MCTLIISTEIILLWPYAYHYVKSWITKMAKYNLKNHTLKLCLLNKINDIHNYLYYTICYLRSCTGICVSYMAPCLTLLPLTPPQVSDANG